MWTYETVRFMRWECEFILSEKNLHVLQSMPNNKFPSNDGLQKEFYEVFWEYLKNDHVSSFKSAFDKGEHLILSITFFNNCIQKIRLWWNICGYKYYYEIKNLAQLMVELLQNTSNSKNVQNNKTRFLLIYLILFQLYSFPLH